MASALRTVLLAAVSLASTTSADAQCADWRVRGSGLHLRGEVYASTTWDPDGNGPSPALLVVGGFFSKAGGPHGIAARNIAAWDGTEWHALGDGVGTSSNAVFALAVHNGQLVAGGSFTTAGGVAANRVARWDGAAWHPLAGGVDSPSDARVYALTVFNGNLIVGGSFASVNGIPETNIARWTGAAWQGIGGGTSQDVRALTVFNNQLIAGGDFSFAGGNAVNFIAQLAGDTWQPLGIGIGGGVNALHVFNGQLVAGGSFDIAGLESANNIARWNGAAWQPLGSGVEGGPVPHVRSLTQFNGELIACGLFSTAGGVAASSIARWNGSVWNPLSSGVNNVSSTVTAFDGDLIAGGSFLQADEHIVEGLSKWDGAEWSDMTGVVRPSGDFGVRAIVPWAGSVVLGGFYSTTETNLPQASRHLTAWNGQELRSIGEPNSIVTAAAVEPGQPNFTSNLVVGGQFTSISGVPVNRIARINDTFGFGFEPMGAGFNSDVTAITRFNGRTYAAGHFTASGATSLNHIASWSGSAWQPVGPDAITGTNGPVFCMKGFTTGVTRLSLVVGGSFTSAGGETANRIASFNANTLTFFTSWSPMGEGFNNAVFAVERFNGQTYAGGSFTASGATPLNFIAKWNGTAWEPLGSGLNGEVRAMTVSNGTLIVGGLFTTAGGVNAARIARWDGANWSPVGGGTDGPVFALNTFRNEIQVGGEFTKVRNGVLETPIWGRFSEDGVPWFAQNPASTSARCGENAHFHIEPALGYGGLQYQWNKDGIPLADGPTGSGSTIVSNGLNLHILNVSLDDAGEYDCSLFNGCGGTSSTVATLTVEGGCCPGDFNNDDILNSQDFFDFLTAFFAGAVAADFNEDTVVNSQDFFDFLTAFFAGC